MHAPGCSTAISQQTWYSCTTTFQYEWSGTVPIHLIKFLYRLVLPRVPHNGPAWQLSEQSRPHDAPATNSDKCLRLSGGYNHPVQSSPRGVLHKETYGQLNFPFWFQSVKSDDRLVDAFFEIFRVVRYPCMYRVKLSLSLSLAISAVYAETEWAV